VATTSHVACALHLGLSESCELLLCRPGFEQPELCAAGLARLSVVFSSSCLTTRQCEGVKATEMHPSLGWAGGIKPQAAPWVKQPFLLCTGCFPSPPTAKAPHPGGCSCGLLNYQAKIFAPKTLIFPFLLLAFPWCGGLGSAGWQKAGST